MTNEDELKASTFQRLLTFRERETREAPLRWGEEWIQEQCVPENRSADIHSRSS